MQEGQQILGGGIVLNKNKELSSFLDIKKLSELYRHLAGWDLLCVCNSCVKGLGPHEKGLDYFEGPVNSSSLKFPTGSLKNMLPHMLALQV